MGRLGWYGFGGESGMSVPVLTIAAVCPCGVNSLARKKAQASSPGTLHVQWCHCHMLLQQVRCDRPFPAPVHLAGHIAGLCSKLRG